MPPLAPDQVVLWFADARPPITDDRAARILAVMNSTERDRHARHRHPERAREFLLTRALVRQTLCEYAPHRPDEWTFSQNEHGAPHLDPASLAPGLVFNLSNTTGLVACVVAQDRAVGVDVEWLHRHGRPLAVADRFFAPAELADLHALPTDRQLDRFFDLWTLKEAYIKARGMGLAIPLGKFAFRFTPTLRLEIDPSLGDDGDAWEPFLLSPTPDHRAAVVVRKGAAPARLQVRWAAPFDRV